MPGDGGAAARAGLAFASMSKTALIVKITCAPGKRDDVAHALDSLFRQVETEEGTELYILHDDAANADVLWMYESYRDGDALQVHSSSPAMAELLGTFGGDLMGAPPELILVTPRRAKGDG
jgi:quinol monooxygenase YgiN